MIRNMPYMPGCVYESPPPFVFIGKSPPGAVRWFATKGPPSPFLQKPSSSMVTSAERAKDCKKKPVYVLGSGEATTHQSIVNMPDLTTTPAAISGPRAFQMAGVTHKDLDVVEVYDSFTYTVLATLEALGFCKPGEGGAFVSGQRTAPGGDFPLNTNGGGLSYTHPGMYGIFLLIEAVRQLRGECGERQVAGAKLGLVNGTGGALSSTGTLILGVD